MRKIILVLFVFLAFLVSVNSGYAYSIYVSTDKMIYVINETMKIEGTISYVDPINITAIVYNSTDLIVSIVNESQNGSFIINYKLNETSPGSHHVIVTDGTDSVLIYFDVVSEFVYLDAHLIESSDVVAVNTSTLITDPAYLGGNFSELLDLSISGTLHYGNKTINSTLYHFVLVDQNFNQTYDTLYVDDDLLFLLYNYTEDNVTYPEVEKILEIGEKFKNYIVGEIDFDTGNKILLGRPVDSSVYSPGSVVNFVVLAKNVNKTLLSGQTVNVQLLDSVGNVINSTSNSTNAFGYFVANFLAPTTTGLYTIDLNNSLGIEFFFVKSFKLFGKVTDTADNPMYMFAPDPVVRISATAKDMSDNPIDLSSVYAMVSFPNGSSVTKNLAGSDGLYSYDLDLSGGPTGEYGVKIVGVYGGDQQEVVTGFAIKAIYLEVMAINIDFIGEAEGPEAMVNAFAPGSNVTLIVFLSNVSAGGIMAKGPPGAGGGIIDIDNASTADYDECPDRVSLTEVKDDRGVSWSVNYTAMNLSSFVEGLGLPEEESPPPEILRQCVITFQAPNRTGVYKAGVKLTHPLGTESSGETFGIQRLYAVGSSVDFKGEEFWFFAPNTTIRIKLKVIDLNTSEELSASQIIDGKIIEMYREFPVFADVFTRDYRERVNESINESIITFTAPDSEGFFRMRFKFKANLSGVIEEGVGNAFFMLKKYMIWGEVATCQPGRPCIVGVGENVTLRINVVDIDKGEMLDLGKSGLTCTGCDGLVADVDMIWNDQLMREMRKPDDYIVVQGAVVNSTATLTIVPVNLPTGWYHVDLILKDEITDDVYFGWAWFEIRNFFIETMPLKEVGVNLTAVDAEHVYGINLSVLFAVIPRDPAHPEINLISGVESITVESVKYMMGWPPPDVTFDYNASKRDVILPWSDQPEEVYVINITGLDKTGWHQANVNVTVTGYGSDIGSFWFGMSTYTYTKKYRGMEEWPPIFGPNENLTVNVSAYDFSGDSHNLSENGTKIKSIWNIKTGRPIKVNSSASCVENNCTITANLSSLGSGEYHANIVLNDTNEMETEFGIYFRIQTLVVNIPKIEERWIGYRDSGDRELDINNERDRCNNERWLRDDQCPEKTDKICINLGYNITVSTTYDQNFGRFFCIRNDGEWRDAPPGSCKNETETGVYVVSNATNLWINNLPNMTLVSGKAQNDTFLYAGKNWTVVEVDGTDHDNRFKINHSSGLICGESWINCNGGCERSNYTMTPPSNYSNFYHGYVRTLQQNENIGEDWPAFNVTRDVYVYHNTSYVWMTNETNLTSAPNATVGETITDPYGGKWKVMSISKHRVGLSGINVLGQTGAYINTSLSKIGIIKLERIEEEYLGGWDPVANRDRGMDLDGDGLINGTVYFAMVDNVTAGVYDTFFFSTDNNFSSPISVNDPNMTKRTFGLNDTLTLLSIEPTGNRVRLYSDRKGDWGDLGELKVGDNVTIPIIVKSPTGADETANVSIKYMRVKNASGSFMETLSPAPNTTINGLGELIINLSALGYSEPGEYRFEITVSKDGSEERLEEWRWPFVTMRTFLVETSVGDGGYISGFQPLNLTRYDWESYGEIRQIYTMNDTGEPEIFGVLLHADRDVTCGTITPPADADANNFSVKDTWPPFDDVYRFGIDATNQTVYVDPGTGCNFTEGGTIGPKQLNESINLTFDNHIYMLQVVQIRTSPDYNRSAFGFADVNVSEIEPIRIEEFAGNPSPRWGVMALDLSGTNYNIILANDTAIDYPMCAVWNIEECVKKAWFSTDKNFTNAVSARIGENFTSDLYVSSMGPGFWEGITIGNKSAIEAAGYPIPAIEARTRDWTLGYFGIANESQLGMDLNKDFVRNETFYMLTADFKENNKQNLTNVVVDDDLNITDEWWSESDNYKDFYGNESGGMREKEDGLPSGIWSGWIRFGEKKENVSWEYQPNWEILNYNNTDMLIRKWKWEMNESQNITIIVKTYNFDLTPIQSADVSVVSLMRFGAFGASILSEPDDYSVDNVQNVTDQYGYGLVKLIPNGTWSKGEYMVALTINASGNMEKVMNWFRVGSW